MPATIKIKNSSTASAVPTSSDLVQGELAVNVTDKRLFTENASGTVVELGTNPSILTLPDGSASAPTLTNDGDTNTGIFFPAADTVGITTGGTERARVDSSGNMGLGVTPSAWASSYKALDVGNTASFYFDSSGAVVSNNSFINSSFQYRYKTSNAATRYEQTSAGQHQWFNAASGTAGNAITFTQAMTLDASGNLGVGTTSPTDQVTLYGGKLRISNSTTGTSSGLVAGMNSNDAYISNQANGYLLFGTNNTERARIDSSGNLLVGTTSGGTSRIYAEGGASYHSIRALANTAGNVAIYGVSSNNSSTGYCAYFNNSGSGTGLFISNTAAWQSVSDSRLKDNVQNLNTTEKLLQLRPVDYVWKNQSESDEPVKRSMGFIAQEVQEVFPELVGVSPDGFFSVEYTGLIAPLVKAIQELKAEFDAYKASHP